MHGHHHQPVPTTTTTGSSSTSTSNKQNHHQTTLLHHQLQNNYSSYNSYVPEHIKYRATDRIITTTTNNHHRVINHSESLPGKPYCPLGSPILDVKDLVAGTWNLNSFNNHGGNTIVHDPNPGMEMQVSGQECMAGVTAASNMDQPSQVGLGHLRTHSKTLQEEMDLSRARLQSVKFGIPITKTFCKTKRLLEEERVKAQQISKASAQEYSVQKMDLDKIHQYTKLLSIPISEDSHEHKVTKMTNHHFSRGPADRSKYQLEIRQLEGELNLPGSMVYHAPSAVNAIKHNFQHGHQQLVHDMNKRLELYESRRQTMIMGKYCAFSTTPDTHPSEAIHHMRQDAVKLVHKIEDDRLTNHAWYKEMLHLVDTKNCGPVEKAIVARIKHLVSNGMDVTKQELARVITDLGLGLVLVGQNERLQKLLHFIQCQLGVSDMEYMSFYNSVVN